MPIRQTQPETRQLDLLGGGIASIELHRLFFALMPDDATRAQLAAAAEALRASHSGLRARWINPSRYHATLHFLGDYAALRPTLVDGAIAAADKIHAEPFDWTLDHAASFRGREPPCVLRGAEVPAPMQQLWQALRHTLALAGQGGHFERSFTPHVTLAYSHSTMLEPAAIAPVTWQVTDFVLVHNVVGQGSYQILGRWRMADS
jgi:RNA 2',3'-cyclic 3'-phosphodiesterase